MKKILHFTLGKANPKSANGINNVINGLVPEINRAGNYEVTVLSVSWKQVEKHKVIKREGFTVECFNNIPSALKFLFNNSHKFSLLHLHNVWCKENDMVAKVATIKNLPYLISVHSGFHPDRVGTGSKIFKKIYHKYIQRITLQQASAIHATCKEEIVDIHNYTNTRVFVIPNGVPYDEINQNEVSTKKDEVKLIYVGRFAKEKNISALIEAISLLPEEYKAQTTLSLVGKVNPLVNELIDTNKVNDNVRLLGVLFGQALNEALEESDLFIHPALSDVCPTGVMLAWCKGMPSVITRTSGIIYFREYGHFEMVEPNSYDLCQGIIKLIDNREKWPIYSEKAITLMNDKLNWKALASAYITEYDKILRAD